MESLYDESISRRMCTGTYKSVLVTEPNPSIHIIFIESTNLLYLPPGDLGKGKDSTNGEAPTPVDHTSKP
jgi:hypothetical protein